MQKSLKKRKFIDVFRLLSPSSMLNIPNIMEKNLVMANILRLSLGRSGFGTSFTTPVQRPPPTAHPFLSYNIVLRCIDPPRIHCNHFNGQQTQKSLQPLLQRTSKKWTLNILKDPVFLLQATRTTIPNKMEHKP